MKFISSFLLTGALLSASTCYNLNVGKSATNFNALCNPAVSPISETTPVKCLPAPVVPKATIECNLPVIAKSQPVVENKCTPVPVICAPVAKVPVIECPKPGVPSIPGNHVTPSTPSSATPEPASFALMGFGFLAAGAVRKFSKR